MNSKVNTQNIREYAPLGNPSAFNYDVNGSREKLLTGCCVWKWFSHRTFLHRWEFKWKYLLRNAS